MNSPCFVTLLSLTRSLQAGRINFAFVVALLVSIVLHTLVPAPLLFFLRSENVVHTPSIIRAHLEILPPPVPSAPSPETLPSDTGFAQNLRLKPIPKALPQSPSPPPSSLPPSDKPLARLANAARQQLAAMDQAGNLYPFEAIAEKQEGEVWVRIFFDETGNVIAARLEESSGYPLLDDAALRAVRSLQSLPNDDMESVILPVRFKLKKMLQVTTQSFYSGFCNYFYTFSLVGDGIRRSKEGNYLRELLYV